MTNSILLADDSVIDARASFCRKLTPQVSIVFDSLEEVAVDPKKIQRRVQHIRKRRLGNQSVRIIDTKSSEYANDNGHKSYFSHNLHMDEGDKELIDTCRKVLHEKGYDEHADIILQALGDLGKDSRTAALLQERGIRTWGAPPPKDVPLPLVAPVRWADDKRKGQTPPEFIREHYGRWLGRGLSRADLRELDPGLYQALYNWLRSNELPADIDLPTRREKTDRWLQRVEREGLSLTDPKEVHRVGAALKRRSGTPRWSELARPDVDRTAPPPPVPEVAPALWERDRLDGESPIDFCERVYRPWLFARAPGITMSDLKGVGRSNGLDFPLGRALQRQAQSETGLPGRRLPPPLWKTRVEQMTPPEFIKRHYGPWMRDDATGLIRPDLKRLDKSLYQALAKWLVSNDLPADCPIPTKSEFVTATLPSLEEAYASGSIRDYRRVLSATQRRRNGKQVT